MSALTGVSRSMPNHLGSRQWLDEGRSEDIRHVQLTTCQYHSRDEPSNTITLHCHSLLLINCNKFYSAKSVTLKVTYPCYENSVAHSYIASKSWWSMWLFAFPNAVVVVIVIIIIMFNVALIAGPQGIPEKKKQEVKVIWQKAPHGGPIPRLGVTPGGQKLYHWIPGVGFPISVP